MKLLSTLSIIGSMLLCEAHDKQQLNKYRAAVVEYAPKMQSSDPDTRLLENTQEYIEFIHQAANQGAQIIAFPEDGLTHWENINIEAVVDSYSTEVPDPTDKISPCEDQNADYAQYFRDVSCAARANKIYTVVNLVERSHDKNTNKKIYHNTNVVFDRDGVVIARYHKMNLLNEPVFVPGTKNTATFKTDFGVTFGMFICWDINFKNSALDIFSDPDVTDLVFSAAWFSHLPFYGGIKSNSLSVQYGYARANGVNLLSSGLNGPGQKNDGSGIYLADGSMAEIYITSVRSSKLIVQDVPKITSRKSPDLCQDKPVPAPQQVLGSQASDISNFVTSNEDLSNYTVSHVNLDQEGNIKKMVCHEKFCCSFDVTLKRNPNVQTNYVYKLAAYSGVSQIDIDSFLGLSNCILVACLNSSTESCGVRHKQAPTGVTFESISVRGTFDLDTTFPLPVTLTYELTPVTDYTFCRRTAGEDVEMEIATTQPQESLLAFGLYGRVFENDHQLVV